MALIAPGPDREGDGMSGVEAENKYSLWKWRYVESCSEPLE